MFLNIHIYFIILKTYDQQFTLTAKKSLHIIFKLIDRFVTECDTYQCNSRPWLSFNKLDFIYLAALRLDKRALPLPLEWYSVITVLKVGG